MDNLKTLRHSCEHVLTQAMLHLYSSIKMAMGPAIEEGFYFDFDPSTSSGQAHKISEADFPKIEAEMTKIIKANLPIKREVVTVKKARSLFEGNQYKQEWLDEIALRQAQGKKEKPTVYWTGKEFVDLCAGPHVESTGKIGAFKLLSVAGAYWHGDSKNKMLTRIYGTCFPTKKELDSYLDFLEEAKRRDHRKIGKDLDLFSIDDQVGPGLILWHPKLSIVREEIELYWRKEHRKRGYQYIYTPHIGLSNLWETSGHLDFFKEGMYPPMSMETKSKEEKTTYLIKPMSCPFHIKIYKSRPRSYRELPLRWCELGTVYRYEESGVLHGMLRVRGLTQDDAHIICREDQFVSEVNEVLDFALDINKIFGFDKLNVYLSVRDRSGDKKYVGDNQYWNFAEKTLKEILDKRKIKYQIDFGGAKFYGPAIDLKAVDSLGREWQGTTIQLDFNEPQRFKMTYIGEDGKEHVPVMLHRTLLGALERFVGTLIEHCGGAFPVWLAPTQAIIIPITDNHLPYAQQVSEKLKKADIRAEIDSRQATTSYKIRDAEIQKIPYILVVGDREQTAESVNVRLRGEKVLGNMSLSKIKNLIKENIDKKT